MKRPVLPKPTAGPIEPGRGIAPASSEEAVPVAGLGTVPKSKVKMAQFGYTKVNEIAQRLKGIHEAVAHSEYHSFRRIEANDSVTGTGLHKTRVGSPSAGTIWAINRVILAIAGDPSDSPAVNAFPAFYKDRDQGNQSVIPGPADIVLPLLLPGVVGTSVVTTGIVFELPTPCVYRGIEDLALWVNYSGTIATKCSVYVGLDLQVLPESPTSLEIS